LLAVIEEAITMNDDNFDYFNTVVKKKIEELRTDVDKLKDVDRLLGEDATERKKHDLLNSIFALQDVQSTVMDERFARQCATLGKAGTDS
jgi:adenine-specific DNA methylase